MKLNVKALSISAGLLWAAAILIVSAANMLWPGYGNVFLGVVASVYPGYEPGSGVGSVITGTLYGLVDGAIAGAIFGWLYNCVSQKCQ